ncbi:MAG: hypothetical protein EOS25_27040 [Mesorhizobium sp.]|uniref:hypothetical protein n=1 Tax=Mesorhizobium sp. TaxID=1871066 RepID=UPI000FE4637A|nr:hypothetical protein [Mesorhizobium sp.]RWD41932.1 MAG: hypothetical protein EOS59_27370 [Mesorhizobium sp.]RWE62538.1 MAG: hypothetical protein EOS24_08025 [Mesorhizobium sp.]RWF13135.1 MAG: hypothetical protein EOS69_00060 [Mesorhizobium sp.]RWF14483.1 MAG: hypothetical protein EOS25_27040 [Mesorhizobium sp.]TIW49301.1 MAG: hypothetical protein E5V71_01415 [Mesorhizobium sp.]
MPNITVRAAAEGMPDVNRRRLLNLTGAGLALAATSATLRKAAAAPIDVAPAGRAKASPELRAAIKAHKRARAHWDSVCSCCDEVALGRKATAAEHQTWDDASNGEYSALWNVCRFPASTHADLPKGRYLKRFHNDSISQLLEEHVDALLLSVMRVGAV